MLLKNTFLFKEIGEEGMLIPIVGGNVDASKIFNLNETGILEFDMINCYSLEIYFLKDMPAETIVDIV